MLDSHGGEIDLEKFVEDHRKDEKRVLADDEIGLVLYVGDLDVFTVSALADPETGVPHPVGTYLKKVSQISQVRFPAPSVRHQIGSVVASFSADTPFLVAEDGRIRKVRADDLSKGMILASGEKVFW
jgi:hypothetical protein